MNIKAILIISILFIFTLFIFKYFDRYTIIPIGFGNTQTHHPIAYKLDRWSGKIWLIRGLDAYVVKNSPLSSPADGEISW